MNFVLKKYFKKKSLRGFSLGEVLLAGFVLTVGLLAISALMVKSLKSSFETRDTIIAVLLAQEGVELVRNVRDNNFAAGGIGFVAFDSSKKHCRIDYNDSVSSLDCNALQGSATRYILGYNGGFYQYDAGSGRFSRYVYVNYDNSAKEATIKSFVYWGDVNELGNIEGGETADCNVAKKCVYTEVFLNSWYTAP